jgi:hypothetical protein
MPFCLMRVQLDSAGQDRNRSHGPRDRTINFYNHYIGLQIGTLIFTTQIYGEHACMVYMIVHR